VKKLLLTLFAITFMLPTNVKADEFTPAQKEELKELFKEYLSESGGTILKSVTDYQEAVALREAQKANEKATEFSKALKESDNLPMTGNPEGDITLVEFFDYNCGYCRRALEEINKVLKDDKNLKVVFMDMPILGPSSVVAAKWSLAAHKQGKYFEYHQAVMDHNGQKDEKVLEKIAKDLDLDLKQLKKDANSDDIQKIIDENIATAASLNIRGTPGFVIAGQIFPGFMQADRIRDILKQERAK